MSIPLGMLLVIIQVLVSKNDLYSSLFECVLVLGSRPPADQSTDAPRRRIRSPLRIVIASASACLRRSRTSR